MKNMTKTRFFNDDINCAAVIHVENKKIKLCDVMFKNKSGYCFDKPIGKNINIINVIKEHSIHEETGELWKAPKIEITTEPLDPPIDMFPHYTASLEMTPQEFSIFQQIAKNGKYLIAFANIK